MSLLLCPVQRNYWFSPSRSAKIFSVAHRRTDVQSILLSHTLSVVVCTLLRLAPHVFLFGFLSCGNFFFIGMRWLLSFWIMNLRPLPCFSNLFPFSSNMTNNSSFWSILFLQLWHESQNRKIVVRTSACGEVELFKNKVQIKDPTNSRSFY